MKNNRHNQIKTLESATNTKNTFWCGHCCRSKGKDKESKRHTHGPEMKILPSSSFPRKTFHSKSAFDWNGKLRWTAETQFHFHHHMPSADLSWFYMAMVLRWNRSTRNVSWNHLANKLCFSTDRDRRRRILIRPWKCGFWGAVNTNSQVYDRPTDRSTGRCLGSSRFGSSRVFPANLINFVVCRLFA